MKRHHYIILGLALMLVGAVLCAAETTMETHRTTGEALRDADAVLNDAYKELMAAREEAQQEALRQAQRAWIRYRDACAAAEGSQYEGGSLQPVIELQCALDLSVAHTERLRALMPGAVADGQTALSDAASPHEAREQAEAQMKKVYTACTREGASPEIVEAQLAWETFRDLWVKAETACYPTDAAEVVAAKCLAALNNARTERLKSLFPEGYREVDEQAAEAADLAYSDPPIMKAAAANDLNTVTLLIERGANVNEINLAEWTALHVAAENGNAEIIAALLNAGARTDLYDFDGRTAADIARASNKPDIANMIEAHGGTTPAPPTPPPPPAENQPAAPETQNLEALLEYFGNLTELRQDQWNQDNQWKLLVSGSGEVSEVSRVGFFSEINDAEYQVTCELPGGDRAVLFLGKNRSDFVHNLDVGDTINFSGTLKNIADWGLWRSAYVKVE